MANLEMEVPLIEIHLLKHLVLELEELQLQSLLEAFTPAPSLTTVQHPVGGVVSMADSEMEVLLTKTHPLLSAALQRPLQYLPEAVTLV